MKKKALLILLFLGLLGINCYSNDDVPVAISPGMTGGVGVVKDSCPTFSWSGVAWAQKYRVVVFGVAVDGKKTNEEIALTTKPVLSEDIAGGGLSWTPSASKGLAEGAEYSWYVGAMDATGTWAWSEPRRFRVEANSKPALNEEEQTALKQKKAKADVNDEKSLRAASGLAEAKATSKDGVANVPEGPMGTEGEYSTFYGTGAGANNDSDDNTNSFFGNDAGYANTSGMYNAFFGANAGYVNTTGLDNVFMGVQTGYSNTTGYDNTFMGTVAGYYNSTGAHNTAIGSQAGYFNQTGQGNVFLGCKAGYNESGSNKLYIDNSDTTSPLIYGDFSTDKLGINGWLGVGTQAPAYPMELKTTGRNAAIVANRTDGAINFVNATTTYGQFGTVNNFAVRILANAAWRLTLNTDNSLAMASGASCTAGGVWTNASSLALKQDITPLKAETAAAALRELNPVTYAYKADASEKYVGFIAEEVPELVAMNDRKALSPMDIVAVLTKVLQEQQKAMSALQNKVSELEKKVAEKK